MEIDSEIHHSSKLDRESDARRDEALRAAGFEVLRVSDEQLWERPQEVVDRVRVVISAASSRVLER
ncbi:MAG: endonuclease domain-containing protein [Actinomycetota bacterium]|nr:endonuclease domain-containing protein [Actinomycetota bacterium]